LGWFAAVSKQVEGIAGLGWFNGFNGALAAAGTSAAAVAW